MKLHPRTQIVAKAGYELCSALLSIIEKHQLTYGEVTAILADQLQMNAKYQIRNERHGNSDEPGDAE